MKFITVILLIFIILVITAYFLQRSIIYQPSGGRLSLDEWGMTGMKEVILNTHDGLAIISWYKPASNGKATLVYFQGNAGNIAMRGKIVQPFIEKGYGILLVGYRGYNGNPGQPTEQDFYQDAETVWHFLLSQHIPPNCIVLYGESLGSGVAIQLASQHQVGALIVLAPYTSMLALGYYHYPFLPVKLILKDHFDSLSKIANVKVPLLVLAAENDSVVPLNFSKRLYEAANSPKVFIVYRRTSHNDLSNKVQKSVISFLEKYLNCKK